MDRLLYNSFMSIQSDKMTDEQLKSRNIKSEAVLDAMRKVPRHLFVPENQRSASYEDFPLPIGFGQTISQPYIVAYMTEQLEIAADNPGFEEGSKPKQGFPEGMKILEIGTGSGYQAAILAYLGCEVYSVELVEELAERAGKILSELKFNNVKVRHGNGYKGWPEEAPFDAIIVTAAPEKIPEKLIEQLKEGGKLILPIGPEGMVQYLKLITKNNGKIAEKELLLVRFVPMVE